MKIGMEKKMMSVYFVTAILLSIFLPALDARECDIQTIGGDAKTFSEVSTCLQYSVIDVHVQVTNINLKCIKNTTEDFNSCFS